MELSSGLMGKLNGLEKVDVVIGILPKNVESTVLHVMNVVREGVLEHLSAYNTLIVVSDGFSTDRTLELAQLFEIEPVKKLALEQVGEPGKGNGIRTVLEIAHILEVKAVGIVDGDLLSIRPAWIGELIQPVLYGRSDLVVPFYVRDKFDGVITNNLAYPFTKAFYGIDVRQPIGGEFGLSKRLFENLREHPLYPGDFGIDIFITTVAAAGRHRIREAMLGLKLHESTTKYVDPESSLIPMFRQVVGTMYSLAAYYMGKVERNEDGPTLDFDDYHGPKPVPVHIDTEKMLERFSERFREFKGIYENLFPKDIYEKLEGMSENNVNLDAATWANCVWYLFKGYQQKPDIGIVDALRVLWIARFMSYYKDCKDLDLTDAEGIIREQSKIFKTALDKIIT